MELILLRHAKASRDNRYATDRERPLEERGISDSKKIGNYLKSKNILPSHVLCSTAVRTRQTIDLILKELKIRVPVEYSDEIYSSSLSRIINKISEQKKDTDRIMVVGHNPDMEELVEKLTGGRLPYDGFGTSAFAVINFDMDSWEDILYTTGKLTLYISPKMID